MEVLIVLVILGIILGFSGTKLESYRLQSQLQNEARALSSQIRKVQLESMISGSGRIIDQAFIESSVREALQSGEAAPGSAVAGLAITVQAPVRISHDGSCSQGSFLFDSSDFRYSLAITGPLCDATITRIK